MVDREPRKQQENKGFLLKSRGKDTKEASKLGSNVGIAWDSTGKDRRENARSLWTSEKQNEQYLFLLGTN